MNMQSMTAIMAVAAIATLALTGGAANADPGDRSDNSVVTTTIAPGVGYTGSVVDRSVVLSTDAGSLTVQDNQFQVLDAAGNLIGGIPLTYQRDGKDWPIAAKIDGRTATLMPSTAPADARPSKVEPLLKDVDAASDALFNGAITNAFMQLSLGTALGTLVGVLAIPGFLGGCIATAAVTGPIGGMIGMVTVGVPVAIAAAIQYFNTVNHPPAPAS